MAVDGDVIRRVGEYQIDLLSLQKHIKRFGIARITTNQTVRPELPNVSWLRDGRSQRQGRDFVLCLECGWTLFAIAVFVKNEVNLGNGKAGQFDLEVQIDQTLEFNSEPLRVCRRLST